MLRLFIACMIAAAPLSAIAADVETGSIDRSSLTSRPSSHSSSHAEAVQDPIPLQPGANVIALRRGAQMGNESLAVTPKRECRTGIVGGGFCVLN